MKGDRDDASTFAGILRRLVAALLDDDPTAGAGATAGELRLLNPELTRDELAQRVVQRYALRCGTVGAVTGISGLPALGVAGPASLVSALALQVRMILEVANLYGHSAQTRDFETDVLLIMAGDAAKEIAKRVGVEASREAAYRSVRRWAARQAVRRLEPPLAGRVVVVRTPRAVTTAGRFLPLVGAPVGFAVDWLYARAVGQRAIAYYRRESLVPASDGPR